MLVRAWTYIRTLGAAGLREVSEVAVLNANYLRVKLQGTYPPAYDRICMHETVLKGQISEAPQARTLDIAKRLIDYGFHPPTVYFPLIVPEALMIEPTETESKRNMDAFIDAMLKIADEARRGYRDPAPGADHRAGAPGRRGARRAPADPQVRCREDRQAARGRRSQGYTLTSSYQAWETLTHTKIADAMVLAIASVSFSARRTSSLPVALG